MNAIFQTPKPINEPIYPYAPGEKREMLKKALGDIRKESIHIPLIINGQEVFTSSSVSLQEPHALSLKLADCSQADEEHAQSAITAALKAKPAWERMPWEERAAIFLKTADLIAHKYRNQLNGATMLGQSKTVHQAEIDSACELIDFLRFNVTYMEQIYREQPGENSPGIWNRLEHRPLEGFVFAITPFNFTAIAANLPAAPALMGNTVVWKPSSTATLSGYYFMKILKEAGLPDGVINFLPGPSGKIAPPLLKNPHLSGVHFTGSTAVFQSIWKTIGTNIESYQSYPRVVGETGGKDFVFAHPSADYQQLATALVRGAFEYQGQKCSAASRAYIPKSLWKKTQEYMEAQISSIKVGDVTDLSNFMGALIDEKSFTKVSGYIQRAKESQDCSVYGGEYSKKEGYFVHPTVIEARNPHYESMVEEIFGPVLTVYTYEDKDYSSTLDLCNSSSSYALTGSIFSQDRQAICEANEKLLHAAGNFYINDKPTGAVVGQQPFGGGRASGTNDKAGSLLNLLRWVSPRTIKETFVAPTDYTYPFMR